MSTKGTKVSLADTNESSAEPKIEREPSRRIGEGLGAFRGLLIMAIFYLLCGFLVWFAWNEFRHWRGR